MAHLREYIQRKSTQQESGRQLFDKACLTSDGELDDLVFSLCKCIPGLAEPTTGAHGHTAMFLPLRIATMHFQSRCLWEWASWVEDVRAHIFYRGIRPPVVKGGDYPVVRSLLEVGAQEQSLRSI